MLFEGFKLIFSLTLIYCFFPRTFLEDARRNTKLSPNTSRRVWIDASVQIRKISPSLKKNIHDVWKHRCQSLSDKVFHYIIDIFGDKFFCSIQQSMLITHWHAGIGKYGLLSNSLWQQCIQWRISCTQVPVYSQASSVKVNFT